MVKLLRTLVCTSFLFNMALASADFHTEGSFSRITQETVADSFTRQLKGLQAEIEYQNQKEYYALNTELNVRFDQLANAFYSYLDEIFQRDKLPAGWIKSKGVFGVDFFIGMHDIHFATRPETKECWAAFKACAKSFSTRKMQVQNIEDYFNN